MAQGLLTKDITLSYHTGTVFAELPDLQDIPDLGGEIEKVEITTLADGNRRYINGIKDFGDLAFTFLYGNGVADSFRILTGLEAGGLAHQFRVELGDGTIFAFSGFPSVVLNGAGVNEALTFTLNIALNSEMDITNPV